MSVRESGSLSRAKGAELVFDQFLRGWRLMTKKKKKKGGPLSPVYESGPLRVVHL